jgi:hypothetical protein
LNKDLSERKFDIRLSESPAISPAMSLPSSKAQGRIVNMEETSSEEFNPDDLNLKAFKKIDVIYINEPARIVDRVKEMVNLVLRLNNSEKILPLEHRSALRDTITLARAEALQEINILDFEYEDNAFLRMSNNLLQDLSCCLGLSEQFSKTADTSSAFSDWAYFFSRRIIYSLRRDVLSGQAQDFGTVLVFKTLTERRVPIRVAQSTTILEIKQMMYRVLEGPSIDYQYLVCRGKKLDNGGCVADYALRTNDYVYVLLPIWE